MNLQGRDLSLETQGEDVHLLHTELQQLGYEFPAEETERSFFGEATHQAVIDFQRKHGLEPNGIVNERTAHAINTAVDAQRPIPDQLVVSGQVCHQDETPLEGLIVRAFDIDLRSEAQLGEETITDGRGAYEITYSGEALSQREKRRADLLVRVYSPEGTLLAESAVRSNAGDHETVDLVVEPQIEPGLEEEVLTYEITLRLLNQETDEALSGYAVRAFDLDAGEEPVELGSDITNARGVFRVVYTPPRDVREVRLRLRLHVIDAQGEEIHQTEIVVAPEQAEVVDVRIPVPEVAEPPSPVLVELNETLQLELPQELLARLEEENIRTVDDIRKAGGIKELENLPVATDHPAVRVLEAHANLSVLSSDVQINETLIENGFDSLTTIANTTEGEFSKAIPGLGEQKAIQFHAMATAQNMFLNNVGTMLGAEQANNFEKRSLPAIVDKLVLPKCECKDCESAVSPLAYLPDLLNYTLKHLKLKKADGTTRSITLDDLTRQFHQPFGDLPASCQEMDNKVPQVRLCIEVLRRYLRVESNRPVAGSTAEKNLEKAEHQYRLEAYESLLTQFGTSYEEIRLARTADTDTRKALAAKLGIELDTNRPDQLDQLLLNTDPTAETEFEELTENHLEVLFGLVSTDIELNPRNPLSDGPTLNDERPQIIRWNLTGVEWNRNTDADGIIYVTLQSPAQDDYRVWLYRDSSRTQLVASGRRPNATGTVELQPENSSGLSGRIEIAHHNDSNSIQFSAIPTFLSWRLKHLRTLWEKKDWPDTPPAGARPLIDPDLINLSDVRTDLESNSAYDLWKKRSKALSDLLAELKTTRAANATARGGFEAICEPIFGESVDIIRLLTRLREREKQGESIAQDLKQHHLTSAAFKYLLRFLDLVDQEREQILDSEWDEVYNLLVESKKRSLFSAWRQEEEAKSITLGPDFFKLRDTALTTYPPPKPASLPSWRATRTERLNWEDLLESRVDKEESVIEAFEDSVDKVGEETLEDLRDALIMASRTTNEDFSAKAKWVTDNLLIDAQTDACQQTTRISQAIETLQNLLWSMRTGQLYDTYPLLVVTDDFTKYFDEEWQWIGSYSTWRAAMLVHLYPENILIPTLRKEQTPAFKQLVKNLRKNRRLNPEQACQEAKAYSDYFRDICNLTVEASCHAMTHVYEGGCRDRKEVPPRRLFYMFARGGYTNTVYWSTYDPKDKTEYAQTFWQAVPKLGNVENIIGAQPYDQSIYLFIRTKDGSQHKLFYIKYDLKNQRWGQAESLKPPAGVDRFRAVLNQRLEEWRPRLGVYDEDSGEMYTQKFSADGTDWEEDEFQSLSYYGDLGSLRPRAMHQPKPYWIIVIYQSTNNVLHATLYEYPAQYNVYNWVLRKSISIKESSGGEWLGSFQWKGSNDFYIFWKKNKVTSYQVLRFHPYHLDKVLTKAKNISGIGLMACSSGAIPSSSSRYIARTRKLEDRHTVQLAEFTRDNQKHLLPPKPRFQIAPQVAGPFDIVERLSQKELQARAKQIKQAFQDNKGEPYSVRTYLEEAYYFVPVHLALRLQKRGHYIAALDWFRTIYDYTIPEGSQTESCKIYYKLVQEEKFKGIYQRCPDWLRDPLNPHLIASTRLNAYTRFTLLSIVRCLLAYADAEFTRDTAESLPQARTLYLTALDILETKALKQGSDLCEEKIGELVIEIEASIPSGMKPIWLDLKKMLQTVSHLKTIETLTGELRTILATEAPWEDRFSQARDLFGRAIWRQSIPNSFAEIRESEQKTLDANHRALLGNPDIFDATKNTGAVIGRQPEESTLTHPPGSAISPKEAFYHTRTSYHFCISANPVLRALRLKIQLNLHKLRNCQNIAGMKRTVDPYTSATDQVSGLPRIGTSGQLELPGTVTIRPTLYRYAFLIERAKQLVNIAQQIETAMLSAIEKHDAEAYNRLKAKQDVQLTRSQLRLQNLRVKEAKDGVTLAELQRDRAQIQFDHYTYLIDTGLIADEKECLNLYIMISGAYTEAALALTAATIFGGGTAAAYAAEYAAKATESWARYHAQKASFERRAQEWAFQKNLAQQDIYIGAQQLKIAQDHVQVVGQERNITRLQTDHAKETLDFLTNKFTNAELYDWMSDTLEEVYAYFLQEATDVAKLAENQLAFERQATPPNYIQDDYWEAPSEDMVSTTTASGKTIDRRGLTGSARLLQDIYQLDQYSFETDKRKLQLEKTISLAALSPVEFHRFWETGVLKFRTPMDMFDRDFPGHYLRLIKRVRTSVVALIPPTQGIHATLLTTGTSRVVIAGNVFQTVSVRRNPELIALTSPRDATGLFELQQQTEMLLPFEGIGVDTSWEFRLPKAANQFDYSTIADVLITIEYTALSSSNYRQQVLQTLSPKLSGDRPFSFRQEFADAWYDLHNPEQSKTPMTVTFKTRREDFPPNLKKLTIQHLVLYIASATGENLKVQASLEFRAEGGGAAGPYAATSIDGVISTRRGNGSSWMSITGAPIGQWKLILPDTKEMRNRFKEEKIRDILFVITYEGRTPDWPA